MDMAFSATGRRRKADLLEMKRKTKLRRAIGIVAFLICMLAALPSVRAASAVAIALDPKTKKWQYGYWHGGVSENEVKDRSLRVCQALGGTNARIIASTSRRGYGALVVFQSTDKYPRFSVSLAAKTEQLAIQDALQKAKAAGGRYAKVLKTWNDSPTSTEPKTIKL